MHNTISNSVRKETRVKSPLILNTKDQIKILTKFADPIQGSITEGQMMVTCKLSRAGQPDTVHTLTQAEWDDLGQGTFTFDQVATGMLLGRASARFYDLQTLTATALN